MHNEKWPSYNELAWTEPIIAPPEQHAEETEFYCSSIKKYSRIKPETLLHLASGAGINDYTFKKHFQVTGVDISPGMLEVAKKINPEVTYHLGDMRTADLGKQYDAVVLPDAAGYLTTVDDLIKTFETAYRHLKNGGVFLVVAHIKEEFQDNNFVYTGAQGDTEIIVFENNYTSDKNKNSYEATMVYLIRNKGKLEIFSESHLLGLFELDVWLDLFKRTKFELAQEIMDQLYEPYILGEGEYPLRLFVGIKE